MEIGGVAARVFEKIVGNAELFRPSTAKPEVLHYQYLPHPLSELTVTWRSLSR
jgi:hypothetical protein